MAIFLIKEQFIQRHMADLVVIFVHPVDFFILFIYN